ncbi:MAG: hypothetical protein ACRC9L_06570 [Brevinema sp.]
MRKILFLITLLVPVAWNHANVLDQFLSYQELMFQEKDLYEIDNVFKATSKQRDVTALAKVFMQRGLQASYLVQNGRPIIFLTTRIGTWVVQENLPNPLKVGGSYAAFGVMSIDDILGIDYRVDYEIVSNGNPMLLKSKNNNSAYAYIELKQITPTNFESRLMDRNQRPIKSGAYELGVVNSIKTIKKAAFQDLVFDTNRTSSFEVTSIKKSAVPAQLLSPERIKLLFNQVKQ